MADTPCANPPVCRCNKDMTDVDCRFAGITSIPDLPVTAVTVDLRWNNIPTIPTLVFSKLSKLQQLYLNSNRIQTVHPLAFKGLESLIDLRLSYNNINTIPSRTFSKLSKLQRVDLRYSHIETIKSFAFEDLNSLTELLLDSNNIVTIRTHAFSKLPILESLDLSNNQIQLIEPYTCNELQNLTKLDLRGNNLQTLENNCFAYIPRLKRLYLNGNKLQTIIAGAFTGTENISEINLAGNLLSEVPTIGPQPCLNTFDLTHNWIINATFPTSYNDSYDELSIDLSYNKMETLDKMTFSSLTGTTIVDVKLHNNNISSVGPGIFDTLASIEKLYIGGNPLNAEALKNTVDDCDRNNVTYAFMTDQEMIDEVRAFMNMGIRLGLCPSSSSGRVFKEFQDLTIIRLTKRDLVTFSTDGYHGKKNVFAMDLAETGISTVPRQLPTSLESLDLSGNRISRLLQYELQYLENLDTLLLSRNKIVIVPGAFNGLGKLRVLDLAQTGISCFDGEIFEPLRNLLKLYLGKNQIKVLKKLSKPILSIRHLDLSDNGIETIDAPFSELFPSLHVLSLASNNLGKTGFKSEKGAWVFSGLTELEEINISRNNIRTLPDMIFRDLQPLKFLNIGMNQIYDWSPNVFQFTKNVTKLDMHFNRLSVLKENHLQNLNNLRELNLEDNPFICDCDILWFREWIETTSIALPGKASYKCHGHNEWSSKAVLEFTEDQINCTVIPIILGALAGAVIITVLSGVLVYRNRWRLRLRLYLLSKRGKNFLQDARGCVQHPNYGAINDDGRGDYYDAYISCNELDYDWVLHHLLPGVDNGHHGNDMFGGDFRLYYDPRDQQPGTMAIANIFEHMSRSRKVIVVLTPDYLRDGMNIFELDQATTLYHDQDLDDIIVVKIGDVPAGRVPAHLYTQMRTGRFLEWEQDVHAMEQFKEKLKDRLRGDRVDLC